MKTNLFRDIIVTWLIIYIGGVLGAGLSYLLEGKLTLFEVFIIIPNVMAIIGLGFGLISVYVIRPVIKYFTK